MCDKKRPIYSETEKTLLKELVLKYSYIIENKNTDSTSNKRKSQTWDKISEEYNQCSSIIQKATVKQLQSLWKNIKHRQREILVTEKQYRHRSGGAQGQPDVPIDPLVASAVQHLIVEIPDVIDCDTSEKEMIDNSTPEATNDELFKKNDASIPTVIAIATPQHIDHKKQDAENRDSILFLENPEDFGTELVNDAGDKMSTPLSSCRKRTKWSSRISSLQSSQLKGHDIRTLALQNETNARIDRYAELSKNEREIHASNIEAVRYKVMAEQYRAENERKQLEITELSKKAAEIKLKILEKQYRDIFNKENNIENINI